MATNIFFFYYYLIEKAAMDPDTEAKAFVEHYCTCITISLLELCLIQSLPVV